jgi:hypothetical protein
MLKKPDRAGIAISDGARMLDSRPGLARDRPASWIPTAPDVVWLTTDKRTVPSENDHIFRVTVKIHSTDRKLLN